MGLSVLNQPAAAGGGIKSVQRGSAGGAGNVTITAVDIAKSFVTVFGTTSSGTVAASAAVNAANGNWSASNMRIPAYTSNAQNINNLASWPSDGGNSNNSGLYVKGDATFTGNSTNLTGGSNNLVAAVVQGYLSNSTTLVVSGACRWEVVEFN